MFEDFKRLFIVDEQEFNTSYELGYDNLTGWGERFFYTYYSQFGNRYLTSLIEASILGAIFVVSFITNMLIIGAIALFSEMRNSTNYFLLNLALADLVFAFSIPAIAYTRITQNWVLGDVVCKIVPYSQFVCCFVLLWTLTFISMDRYQCIVIPPYRSRLTTIKTTLFAVGTWLISLIIFVPLVFWFREQKVHDEHIICTIVFPKTEFQISYAFVFTMFALTVACILPMGLLVYFYYRIFRKIVLVRKRLSIPCILVTTNNGSVYKNSIYSHSNFFEKITRKFSTSSINEGEKGYNDLSFSNHKSIDGRSLFIDIAKYKDVDKKKIIEKVLSPLTKKLSHEDIFGRKNSTVDESKTPDIIKIDDNEETSNNDQHEKQVLENNAKNATFIYENPNFDIDTSNNKPSKTISLEKVNTTVHTGRKPSICLGGKHSDRTGSNNCLEVHFEKTLETNLHKNNDSNRSNDQLSIDSINNEDHANGSSMCSTSTTSTGHSRRDSETSIMGRIRRKFSNHHDLDEESPYLRHNSIPDSRRASEVSMLSKIRRKFSSNHDVNHHGSTLYIDKNRQNSISNHEENRLNKHLRVMRIIFLNVIVILVMWLPITIITFLIYQDGIRSNDDFFLRSHHFVWCLMIALFNTVVNPLLYGILSENFRSCLKKWWFDNVTNRNEIYSDRMFGSDNKYCLNKSNENLRTNSAASSGGRVTFNHNNSNLFLSDHIHEKNNVKHSFANSMLNIPTKEDIII